MTDSLTPLQARRAARRLARQVFGYRNLRAGQEDAIKSVLEGHDTLAVMPTGSGKSAIYQIAALSLDGPTIVVSPLIALQRDQVDSLQELQEDGSSAALLNSTLSASERAQALRAFQAGELEFLFLAPEQLTNDETVACLRASNPSLFVVDEAHCVSEWGFDFRPDYLRLGAAIEALGHPRVLALTATAAPPVRAEIVERLGMIEPRVIVSGFDRPNLTLCVTEFEQDALRRDAVLKFVQGAEKPGLVYAATRKKAEELAEALSSRGLRSAAYHAGMKAADRDAVQRGFMADAFDVIVATTAFGMGIDKPNVRFVAHADLPGSLDAYYQEIGRAGRDGELATVHLFFTHADTKLRKFFASGGLLAADDLQHLLSILEDEGRPVAPSRLSEETSFSQTKLTSALTRLEEVGAIRFTEDGAVEVLEGVESTEAAQAASTAQHARKEYERSRLEMMRAYAGTRGCRRAFLLGYFGEAFEPPCDRCDTCRSGRRVEADENAEFGVGERVRHKTLGEGQVTLVESGKVTVLFDEHGYQALALKFVRDNELLEVLDASNEAV
ncbi:RecQ family ATP-dependent DNA helicase [Deinococcus yavapaiensis]|uniref:ATP-dependent DNA helicase RecQ n=1 Tax=Deinococcus yavapaiensis KR-236 TaxID=694435 RepID=A0A318S1S3_9DEIO|nr:ATP-dependent DNA helicase RecQ [Deinococcus yavapaiensis]PYE51876.1 ATP-dependent DNA helicase RecQ [Deinococcus yavapaiensis KR-236]